MNFRVQLYNSFIGSSQKSISKSVSRQFCGSNHKHAGDLSNIQSSVMVANCFCVDATSENPNSKTGPAVFAQRLFPL